MSNDDSAGVSPYTIANLMELEDLAKGFSDDIEARFARRALGSEHLGVTYMRFDAGARAPFGHSHRGQEEAYVVLSGSGEIKIADETLPLARWDVVRLAPSVPRAVRAGDEGLELLAVGSDAPEDGDGVAHHDFWDD